MKLKTTIAVILTVALCCVLFAACDAGADAATVSPAAEASGSAPPAASASTEAAQAVAVEAAAAAANPGTAASAAPAAQVPAGQGTADESTLTVTASETVSVPADVAYVTIGADTTGATAQAAQQANAKTMTAVLAALKNEGVADDDIQTASFYVQEDYNNPGQYIVSNSYSVTIRDLDSVGAVIDAAVAAGANSTYSLSFGLLDRDSVYLQALSKAMRSVGAKATAVAQAGGYTVSRVVSVVEMGTSSYSPYMNSQSYTAMPAAAADAATQVTPGEIEVWAGVTGTYAIA